jgi:hypothetical protein
MIPTEDSITSSTSGACVVAVADACYGFNGRFDRERFYRAAGLD